MARRTNRWVRQTCKCTGPLGNEGDESGVTKLTACGHIFCRKDLIAWIRGLHGSCPTCRHIFLDVRPISDSDDESSDGGEYVPDDDVHDTDNLSEFDTELEMDMEMDELWADGDDEYEEGDPIECEEVYESEGEYDDESVGECGEEFMDDDMGLSEGDTSSEMDLGYPVDEIMDDDISITVAGEDTPLYSDNVPEDNDNDK
ncbi:hypothetical protein ONZ45_g15712 [Pleurotus djamor]|nr:hypothetical protein ONZ45_g15712 [Pleurotus djamor]